MIPKFPDGKSRKSSGSGVTYVYSASSALLARNTDEDTGKKCKETSNRGESSQVYYSGVTYVYYMGIELYDMITDDTEWCCQIHEKLQIVWNSGIPEKRQIVHCGVTYVYYMGSDLYMI